MRRRVVFLLFSGMLFAKESFITPIERGEMLYHTNGGISCAVCHGASGNGQTLASYTRKGIAEAIVAPSLIGLRFEAVKKGITKHRFGPQYRLSDSEIEAITLYLKQLSAD
ncbi:MAG: cytochrome c [Helicobacteraceae bacterium]|jgi:cytochrome c553|nr:cytochrome c [Helicobacteraceae bacterium]